MVKTTEAHLESMNREMQYHCYEQFKIVEAVLQSYLSLLQEEWSCLAEITSSTLEENREFAKRNDLNFKKFIEYFARFIDKRYLEKQDGYSVFLDLMPVWEATVLLEDYARENKESTKDIDLATLLYEVVSADHDYVLKRLVSGCEQPISSYERLQYLFSIKSYYRQVGHQNPFDASEVKILLHVDRKFSEIREEVAKFAITSKQRMRSTNHGFKKAVNDLLTLEENYHFLNKLIETYKKEGKQFKNIEQFTQSAESFLKNRKNLAKASSSQKRSIQQWLEKAGVTAENFPSFYNSAQVTKLTVF